MCESNGKSEQIAAAMSGCFGRAVRVKFVVSTEAVQATAPKRPPGAKTSQNQIEEAKKDPAVNLLMREMRASILDIKEQ